MIFGSNFYLCVTLLSLCEHRCVSHLEAFSLTAVSAFSSALLRKKTEIFAEIWWRIMFRMCTYKLFASRCLPALQALACPINTTLFNM